MQNILELKYKVMNEKLTKLQDFIKYYFVEEKEEKTSLLKAMQILRQKYEKAFKKIQESKNINKSIKYKQLEKIVMETVNKIEIEIVKHIKQNENKIYESLQKAYKDLIDSEYSENKLEKLEKIHDADSYFYRFLGKEKLNNYYLNAKFEILFERTKVKFFEEKEDFNEIIKVKDKNEKERQIEFLIKKVDIKRIIESIKEEQRLEGKDLGLSVPVTYVHEIRKGKKIEVLSQLQKIEKYLEDREKNNLGRFRKKPNFDILLIDFVIRFYLIEDIKSNIVSNRKYYYNRQLLDISELTLTKKQARDNTSVKLKLLTMYLRSLAEKRKYSIEEVQNVLKRFGMYDDENITLMCNVNIFKENTRLRLAKYWKILEDRYKSESRIKEAGNETVLRKPRKIRGNLFLVTIPKNDYVENEKRSYLYRNTRPEGKDENLLDGMIVWDSQFFLKEEYEKIISPKLNQMGIWNEFFGEDEYYYVVAIDIDDFKGIPINTKGLKSINDNSKILKKYLNSKLEETKNMILYYIPDEKIRKKYLLLHAQLKEESKNIRPFENYDFSRLNKLNEDIFLEISKIGLPAIIKYRGELLDSICDELPFEEKIEKINNIALNNNLVEHINPLDVVMIESSYRKKYLEKKFEIIYRRILENDEELKKNVDLTNIEREDKAHKFIQNILESYCSESEYLLMYDPRIFKNRDKWLPVEDYIFRLDTDFYLIAQVRNEIVKEKFGLTKNIREEFGLTQEEKRKGFGIGDVRV